MDRFRTYHDKSAMGLAAGRTGLFPKSFGGELPTTMCAVKLHSGPAGQTVLRLTTRGH